MVFGLEDASVSWLRVGKKEPNLKPIFHLHPGPNPITTISR